jgi:hypothetical protein
MPKGMNLTVAAEDQGDMLEKSGQAEHQKCVKMTHPARHDGK